MTLLELAAVLLLISLYESCASDVYQNFTVDFYLATRGDPVTLHWINETEEKIDGLGEPRSYEKPQPTVVLLHGLGGSVNSTSNILLAEGLLQREGYNIIIANYEEAVEGPDYITAAKNVGDIGRKVGQFLLLAQQGGFIALSSTTIIGFSLGAHVAGVAGFVIKEASAYLDRIIGLDPAAPWFAEASLEDRLDKCDAGHVFVIHTAGGYIALNEAVGNVDFYPNGGKEAQPLCAGSRLSSVMCSHMAAYRYLAESIMRPGFIATKCDSWEEYEAGRCNHNEKAYMGFDADPQIVEGKYYLRTNKEPPFGSPLESLVNVDYKFEEPPPPEVLQEFEDEEAPVDSNYLLSNSYQLCPSVPIFMMIFTAANLYF